MKKVSSRLYKYDYHFPASLIAQSPASPRDAARLLVYNRATKEIQFDTFSNLMRYLPPRSVLVFNQTKVIPARFTVTKETGGRANLLYLSHTKKLITVLSDRRLNVGATLKLSNKAIFTVHSQQGKYYHLKPLFPLYSLITILNRFGRAPLPPYIKHTPLSKRELKQQYQTIFARTPGSIAAPTASLHFTKRLLRNLKQAGHNIKFVTLHVNLGTFAPVTEEQIKRRKLHHEWYSIEASTARFLNRAKTQGRPIVAVGTTVARTLESATNAHHLLTRLTDNTELFIREGYQFKFADSLITNFHVPRSSLLMLIAAFAGRNTTLTLYQTAIRNKFRLFSFGDGMLLL